MVAHGTEEEEEEEVAGGGGVMGDEEWSGREGGERQERRVDGIAGHYSETRICSFVSSLCMRRGVCASFYRLKSRLRITVQMIFFRVRTRNPLAHAAPQPYPVIQFSCPFSPYTYIPPRSCASLTSPCLRYSSVNLCHSFCLMLQRPCMGRQHSPSPPPPTTQKEFKTGARTRRCAAR